jgi:hypothetical protein
LWAKKPRRERAAFRRALDAVPALYVAPHGIGNDTAVPVRIAWALDALASVEAAYAVAPEQRVIAGFSGGAAVAVQIGAFWPDVFVGTLDQCRAVMWEPHEIASIPGAIFGMGEVDPLDPDELDALVGGPRFAFVTGDRDSLPTPDGDFLNYEGIMDGIGDWWDRGIRARVWDVPGQGHSKAGGQSFASALEWVLTCADDGSDPPRFDDDFLPPHTPFPTPASAPPAACDPGDPASDGGSSADPAGCGCAATGPSCSTPRASAPPPPCRPLWSAWPPS